MILILVGSDFEFDFGDFLRIQFGFDFVFRELILILLER